MSNRIEPITPIPSQVDVRPESRNRDPKGREEFREVLRRELEKRKKKLKALSAMKKKRFKKRAKGINKKV